MAKAYYEKAADELAEGTEFMFYKGLALQKLGQKEKVLEQFNALNELANKEEEVDFYRSLEAGSKGNVYYAQKLYLRGLVNLGLNKNKRLNRNLPKLLNRIPVMYGHICILITCNLFVLCTSKSIHYQIFLL